METRVSSLGQGPGLAWKRNTSSFPPGSLAELQEWTGGKTEPPWHGEVDFQQWNTIGCGVNDDGVLCIRPWEGDTGTTGELTSYRSAPWYNKRLNIKKVESTGTIVLNANSVGLFYGCSKLTDLTGLANWDVSNVTTMDSMFSGCSKLTDLTGLEDWNTYKLKNMESMFFGCSNLTDLRAISDWNVSNVTNMHYTFALCSSLTTLTGLDNWNVSNVTDMSTMFNSCSNLTDLTAIKDWNVSNVTNISNMFQSCRKLADLSGLSKWNVSNVTNMGNMFNSCSNLTDLTGLEDWNVSKVTDMSTMFFNCSKLTDLSAIKNWNVSNVTKLMLMFKGCSSLQKVGIPSIANGGQKLVANAAATTLTTVLPNIISEDGSMGPYTWPELANEMTTNPDTFREGTVWVRASEEAE